MTCKLFLQVAGEGSTYKSLAELESGRLTSECSAFAPKRTLSRPSAYIWPASPFDTEHGISKVVKNRVKGLMLEAELAGHVKYARAVAPINDFFAESAKGERGFLRS